MLLAAPVVAGLTDVTKDGGFFSHYGYDADDNRTTYQNAGGTVHPTYDAQDRLTTYGSATYGYTADGELTSKTVSGQTTNYTYDALGNLLHVAPPSGSAIDYVVDGENRRVGKAVSGTLTTGLLYQDSLHVVAQLDGSGNTASRFVFGSKPNVPDYYTNSSGTFRILSDHLGSPRLIVNTSSGALIEEIDYDEFGNVVSDTSPGLQPFGFAGGLYEKDTGLLRFGARDYDPNTGRWTAKDPILFNGGMNTYTYVFNDPVNLTDARGLWANVTQTGTNVQITIPIYFYGVGDTPQNVQNIVDQIQNTWSGHFGNYNVTTTVQVYNWEPNNMCPVSPVPINRIQLETPTGNFGSDTEAFGLDGQWDATSSFNTFAHETSHLLGLPDQYQNPNDISYGLQSGRSPNASPSGSDISRAIQGNSWGVEF